MDNSKIPSIPPPPSIPLINLPQPTISTSYDMFFKRKHIMDINGEEEYGDSKQQVEKKLKKQQQRAQQNSLEMQSTGEAIKIDPTLYTVCSKCNKSVLIREMKIHMSCHAAIILDNLLLGDKISASSKKELIERNKVTHVVNAATEVPNYLEKEGIKYLQLELLDDLIEEIEGQVEKACSFIKKSHQEGGIVFVHCAVGKSRSVSVILTYLLKEKGIGIQEGLKMVKQKRPIAQPNFSYMQQLLEYEKKWNQKKTKKQAEWEQKTNDGQKQKSSIEKQSQQEANK